MLVHCLPAITGIVARLGLAAERIPPMGHWQLGGRSAACKASLVQTGAQAILELIGVVADAF